MPDIPEKLHDLNGTAFDIGVDIGGTSTLLGVVDPDGNILTKSSFPTMERGGYEEFVKRLAAELKLLIANAPGEVRGIGIGAPCGNALTGEIESPVHLGWGKVNIINSLRHHIDDKPIFITNDANAAALGEKAYGVAKEMDNFIELTLGTGVGSGIFADGKLVVGSRGMAGELGHLRYACCGDRKCGCGREGCLDAWCSARGIVRTADELLASSSLPSPLRDLGEKKSSYDIFIAATEGDPISLEAFRITGSVLGNAIADMATFSDPEAVILFGGLAQSGPLLLNPVKQAFAANVLPMYSQTKILLSSIPECDAALLGAAALVQTSYK